MIRLPYRIYQCKANHKSNTEEETTMAQENVMKFIEMMQENEDVQAQLSQILEKNGTDEDVAAILALAEGKGIPFTVDEFMQEMKKLSCVELSVDDLAGVVGGAGTPEAPKNDPGSEEGDPLTTTVETVHEITQHPKEVKKVAKTVKKAGGGVAHILSRIFGGSRCFAAGSMVATPDGSIPIESIHEGDEVLTLNAAGEKICGKVTKVHTPALQEIVTVRFTDGKEWQTTATQWYYCGNGQYSIAMNTQGNPAITLDGTATVEKATMTGKTELVYDIEVDGINIMFINGVAAEGFSLH